MTLEGPTLGAEEVTSGVGTFTNKALLLSMTSHQATGDVCTSTCLIGKR